MSIPVGRPLFTGTVHGFILTVQSGFRVHVLPSCLPVAYQFWLGQIVSINNKYDLINNYQRNQTG
jgi:hypothetical protein